MSDKNSPLKSFRSEACLVCSGVTKEASLVGAETARGRVGDEAREVRGRGTDLAGLFRLVGFLAFTLSERKNHLQNFEQ